MCAISRIAQSSSSVLFRVLEKDSLYPINAKVHFPVILQGTENYILCFKVFHAREVM